MKASVFTILVCTFLFSVSGIADESLTLDSVLETALKSNPERQAVLAEEKAATHTAVAEEPILPAPILTIGNMGTQSPFSNQGRIQTMTMISQTIPFPGKTIALRRALNKSAEANTAERMGFDLELKSKVKMAFFEYLESVKRKALLKELISIYQHHLKRLRSGVIQSYVMMSHILSSQNEYSTLSNNLAEAEKSEKLARGELNVLMGKDAFSSLPLPQEPPLASVPTLPNQETIESSIQQHPDYIAVTARLDALESERSAARARWAPDLMLSYRINRQADGSPMNYETMLGISLPFAFFWQPSAKNSEATAKFEAARARQVQDKNELSLRVLKTHAELVSLHQQLETLSETLLPQAQKRIELVQRLSPTDMTNLVEHRDAFEKAVKIRIEAVEKRSRYERALTDWENLTGGRK